jgi:Ferritin-like domain
LPSAEPAGGITRGRLLVAGAAAAAAAVATGARRGDGSGLAAASPATDAEILNFFLTLEYAQAAFYRQAVESERLDGELLALATAFARQEEEHARLLVGHLGGRARPRPRPVELDEVVASAEVFRRTAIDLEEAVIAGYVGQAGHLGHRVLRDVATILSVEARQVAWLRDIDGVSPAPRAADPPRAADDVLDDLRGKGLLA